MDSSAKGLSTLSAECLDLIVGYCYYNDIIALELAGNKALSLRLEGAVTEIDAQMSCLSKWSNLAFRYRRLRSLSVRLTEIADQYPFYVANDNLIPAEGHKALESLSIESLLAFTVLQSGEPHGRPTLSALLPNLKHLHLKSESPFQDELMSNVPPTLISLYVKTSFHHSPHVSILDYLPKSLESLHLSFEISTTGKPDSEPKPFPTIPSTLMHLRINIDQATQLLAALPNTLESLNLRPNNTTIRTSQLPSSLTKLSISSYSPDCELVFDTPLPNSLTSVAISLSIVCYTAEAKELDLSVFAEKVYPPTLTEIKQCLPDALWHFPRLRTLEFRASIIALNDFTNLTSLSCSALAVNDQVILSIPKTLTSLSMCVQFSPAWLETFEKLAHLRSLHLHHGSSVFEAWHLLYDRLDSLICSLSHFGSIEALNGPWTKLIGLNLHQLQSNHLPTFLPEDNDVEAETFDFDSVRLPTTLTSYSIQGSGHLRSMTAPIPRLTRLQSLTINSGLAVANKSQERFAFLSSLPASLRNLNLGLPYYLQPKYFANLPSRLTTLAIALGPRSRDIEITPQTNLTTVIDDRFNYGKLTYGEAWTNEHLKSLPSKLLILSINGYRSIDWMNLILPPTLTCVFHTRVPPTTAMAELNRQKHTEMTEEEDHPYL